jgi:branched-chain amino acid aminotransferase
VRLSSGISANILDFIIPQKHVLTVMKAQETARKASGGEVQACQRPPGPGAARREPEIAPVSATGSKKMSLNFEIKPAANPTPEKERTAKLADPGFGRVFTDHMAIIRYSQAKGWHDARIEARANFALDPATAVLHYAQEIFEGLKAYKRDNGVNLFRPDANARRFRNSADRMAMAPLPEALFIEAVEQLVRIDSAWIPGGEGSLYLRPFMIANEVFLGVKPSAEYIFAVIASPVGSYF